MFTKCMIIWLQATQFEARTYSYILNVVTILNIYEKIINNEYVTCIVQKVTPVTLVHIKSNNIFHRSLLTINLHVHVI